eukprot:GFYU01014211.1.p1 GENE.GFYU01014211.1~~GFYU01014211.1.p1  ORF type:complete len:106 (-),score=8.87 GFYU01014211.1:389-706(-)
MATTMSISPSVTTTTIPPSAACKRKRVGSDVGHHVVMSKNERDIKEDGAMMVIVGSEDKCIMDSERKVIEEAQTITTGDAMVDTDTTPEYCAEPSNQSRSMSWWS